ncbi:MAG: flavodoxin [Planctomycetes bacterium]|nr:flavodoxin [Planctomycetota bacterium]
MAKVLVTYWSGTGNTEKMAECIAEGAKEKGAEVDLKQVGSVSAADALAYDVIAIGSPSMGQEVLEESEVEPFVDDLNQQIKDKKVAIFGSYGWGDGEWMRNWADREREAGANLLDDGLMIHETPSDDDEETCREYGRKLAAF